MNSTRFKCRAATPDYIISMEPVSFLERIKIARAEAVRDNKIIHLRREDLDKRIEGTSEKTGSSAKLGYSWYQTHTRVGIEIPYVLK